MTDLPAAEREALNEAFDLTAPAVAKLSRSVDGTAKHLWRLKRRRADRVGAHPHPQPADALHLVAGGVRHGVLFCATGWAGYRRQLGAGEIVAQYRGARRWARDNGYGEISNIVFMGMGEPLMNPKALFPTLAILNRGYEVGARRITVSTVGVVPGILQLAEMPEQYRLAISCTPPTTSCARS
jgi:23S rRNA (adenine2503-C2)-methyltransferase